MTDKLKLPAEAMQEMYAAHIALSDAVDRSLSDIMTIAGKYGIPNGAAIKPWAQMVGELTGKALEPIGLAPLDIDELAALTAAAIPRGEARARSIRQHFEYLGRQPIDPSLN